VSFWEKRAYEGGGTVLITLGDGLLAVFWSFIWGSPSGKGCLGCLPWGVSEMVSAATGILVVGYGILQRQVGWDLRGSPFRC